MAQVILAAAVFSIAAMAQAAPSVRSINVRGLQTGGTTTLVIDGTDLLPTPRILMNIPIAQQSVKPNATATKIEIDVTLDKSIEPGLYNLWLVTPTGISERFVIGVDELPQRSAPAKADDPPATLPIALHGSIGGSQTAEASFTAKAGQRVVIDVESARLGSKLQPVVHLDDAKGKQIAWSLPSPVLRGDCRLIATLPADGAYKIRLHDLQYAPASPSFYRLKIGDLACADIAFPPAIQRGQPTTVQHVGFMGGDSASGGNILAKPGDSLTPMVFPRLAIFSGARTVVMITDTPEWIERGGDEVQDIPAALRAPFAVNARLAKKGEVDRFKVAVTPETALRFEVVTERIASPVDAVLEIRDAKGSVLAINDDNGSADARLDYTPPKGVDSLVLAVRDVQGRGGEACVYRVAVTQVNAPAPPDFDLIVESDQLTAQVGGSAFLKVAARRRGYNGPIKLRFDKLPAGVQITGGSEIPAGASGALISLTAAAAIAEPVIALVQGDAAGTPQPITRTAMLRTHPIGEIQPWLRAELPVAVIEKPSVNLVFDYATPATEPVKLVLGTKPALAVKATRPAGYDGAIRLTLLTSQGSPVNAQGQDDPNRALRFDNAKPAEIPANAKAAAANDAKVAAEKSLAAAQQQADAAAKELAAQPDDAPLKAKVEAAKKKLTDEQAKLPAATQAVAAAQQQADAAAKELAAKPDDAAIKAKVEVTKKMFADEQAKATAATQAVATAQQQADAAAKELAAQPDDAPLKAKDEAAKKKVVEEQAKLTAAAQAAEAAAKEVSTGEFALIVPTDLAAGGYEVALRADLIARDGKTIVASTTTALRPARVINPVDVQLTTTRIDARLDAKSEVILKITGRINRLEGAKGDVELTLAGPPANVAAPKAVVKADASTFELELKLPPNTALGEVKATISGTIPSALDANVKVKSESAEVVINVVAAAK